MVKLNSAAWRAIESCVNRLGDLQVSRSIRENRVWLLKFVVSTDEGCRLSQRPIESAQPLADCRWGAWVARSSGTTAAPSWTISGEESSRGPVSARLLDGGLL